MSVATTEEQQSSHNNLFPLKLTSFEEYMRLDDRPNYPMSFFIEIKLSGDINPESMDASLKSALKRHPLLTAHVDTPLFGRARWLDAKDFPQISWFDGRPILPAVADRFVDLRKTSGLRIWAGINPGETRIVFQFHHAVTDGLGAIQFIGDLLAYYGQKTCGTDEAPELAPVNRQVLRDRGQLSEPGHEHQRVISHLLWWCTHLACNYPTGIKFPSNRNDQFNDPFVTRIIDSKTTRKLKKEATKKGGTPNEIYTLAMFQLLRQWNIQHSAASDHSAVRVGIPITLRTANHQEAPAANVLSYMLLTRKFHDIENADQTMEYISRTSADVLNSGDHALVTWTIGVFDKFPGLLRAVTHVPARYATAMLANVGDVKRALRNRFPMDRGRCVAGNLILEHLLGAAPTRPGTHLGLSLGHYAGKLYMNLNCDPWKCSRVDAEKMADHYVDLLEQMVSSSTYHTTDGSKLDQPASTVPQD